MIIKYKIFKKNCSLDLVSPNAIFGRKINNNEIDILGGADNYGKKHFRYCLKNKK